MAETQIRHKKLYQRPVTEPIRKLSKATRTVAAGQIGGQDVSWTAFAGSCTTGKVAAKLRRDYVMIDLKPEYIEMGEKRVLEGEIGLSVKDQEAGQGALFTVNK